MKSLEESKLNIEELAVGGMNVERFKKEKKQLNCDKIKMEAKYDFCYSAKARFYLQIRPRYSEAETERESYCCEWTYRWSIECRGEVYRDRLCPARQNAGS